MTASLYIHIPFCAVKCDYCDFFSVPVQNDNCLLDLYIDALLFDIGKQIDFFAVDCVPTVYIGGGTPSVLGAKRMKRLLSGLQTVLPQPINECTVEANPESANEDFLNACRGGGVNRISLGLQTFHEPSRSAVHRAGNGSMLEESLGLCARYFPGAFSVDLIAGLPLQSNAILASDIKRALDFQPAHASLYSLTIEPETPLGWRALHSSEDGGFLLPSGDDADSLWIAGRDLLEQSGYSQYEVSNFALQGKACAHNIRYWRMENWLGAGAYASGTIINEETGTGKRISYPADIRAYIDAPDIRCAGAESLSRLDLMRESLLMGFRIRQGPDRLSFKRRFGDSIEAHIPRTLDRWRERGFFSPETADSLSPSAEGLLFLNAFLRDAFGELQCEQEKRGSKA